MIAIVDYGAGNIFSVKNALDFLNLPSKLTADPEEICNADAIILPGVGAFPNAMHMLEERNLKALLQKEAKKKPFLGICLGMQLLFETGYEFEPCKGLGLIPGTVEKINAPGYIIPHMGWNKLEYGRLSNFTWNWRGCLCLLCTFLSSGNAIQLFSSICYIWLPNSSNGLRWKYCLWCTIPS